MVNLEVSPSGIRVGDKIKYVGNNVGRQVAREYLNRVFTIKTIYEDSRGICEFTLVENNDFIPYEYNVIKYNCCIYNCCDGENKDCPFRVER